MARSAVNTANVGYPKNINKLNNIGTGGPRVLTGRLRRLKDGTEIV